MRVLPFIRMLVLASEQHQVMVRKLRIVWQMDDFKDWMQELLDLDRGKFKVPDPTPQLNVYLTERR
ncbi:hypothetical protein KXV80_001826 [Aspergillus fumigatus]|nr:hypothetical protein KXV80_001826 [Aspergillus fumigatus]